MELNKKESYLKYIGHIFFSYIICIGVFALFGKGYSAIDSFLITLLALFLSVTYIFYIFRGILFKSIDYFFVILIFILQIVIGVLHFQFIINPNYFLFDELGIYFQTYYYDIAYFAYLIDIISQYRLNEGYLSADLAGGVINKNYFLAYLVSDIFYFGDRYALNIISINILSIFYSGILLSILATKIVGPIKLFYRRKIFYFSILTPLAFIPSHTMRDVLGAFIIILSVSLIYFSKTRLQKAILYPVSVILVFQHRQAYFISMIGSILTKNYASKQSIRSIFFGILLIALSIFFVSSLEIFQIFNSLFSDTLKNSNLSGSGIILILDNIFKMIIGPFPWTQFFNGSTSGYASYYFSTILLNSVWQLTIAYFLLKKIRILWKNQYLKVFLAIIILFSAPAFLSQGGHNIYLFPSFMLALIFMHDIKILRFLGVFLCISCLLIISSIIFSSLNLIL